MKRRDRVHMKENYLSLRRIIRSNKALYRNISFSSNVDHQVYGQQETTCSDRRDLSGDIKQKLENYKYISQKELLLNIYQKERSSSYERKLSFSKENYPKQQGAIPQHKLQQQCGPSSVWSTRDNL
eukprot:GHVP01032521.1.p1 GENE.GHVP01032521.1~~GHVP01032521.1.p1  ORF type:complete len:126 (-),score=15.02 GHVP01032521.1:137-514(-)